MLQMELGKRIELRKLTEVVGKGGRKIILTELESEEDKRKIQGRKEGSNG